MATRELVPRETQHKLTLDVTEYDAPGALFLRVTQISGDINGEKFDLCTNVGGGGYILQIGKRQFVLNSTHFVHEVYAQLVAKTKP